MSEISREELLALAIEMRNAIDGIEGALMGAGDLIDLPDVFGDNGRDELLLKPTMTLGQVRRVCDALSECTRIINSQEYSPDALRLAAKDEAEPVAWRIADGEGDYEYLTLEPSESSRAWSRRYGREHEPLYAATPPTAAKDEAEPVAWRYHYGDGNWRLTQDEPINIRTIKECAVESLYATSPTAAKDEARERVIADDAINGVEAIAKLREFDRFALVIESAVRNADAPNLPRVSDLLKRTRVFMSIMGPKSLSPSNPRRMQGEEE